jgi:hypothetical protein
LYHHEAGVDDERVYHSVAIEGKEGDVVFIPLGSAIPILLRKQENGYTVVEECYVHGIMHGEATKQFGAVMNTIILV